MSQLVAERLQYERTWTKLFRVDEFTVEPIWPHVSPFPCPVHLDEEGRSICFRSDAVPWASEGVWRLVAPISVPTVMPGQDRRLTHLSVKGMFHLGWGTWIDVIAASVTLIGDGAKLYESPSLSHGQDSWIVNSFDLAIPVDAVSSLDVSIYQATAVFTGGINQHDAELILTGVYYTAEAPPMATVTVDVLDRETLTPVGGAEVMLLSGTALVARGTTDSSGRVTLLNVDEGSYTLRVRAGGYEAYETALEVVAPETYLLVKLTPKPLVLPDWWWIPVAAAGGLAVAYVLFAPRPPVVVVRE